MSETIQHARTLRLDTTVIRDVMARVGVVYDVRKLDVAAIHKLLGDSMIAFGKQLQDEDCSQQLLDRAIENEDDLWQWISESERAYVDAAESPRARRWRIGMVIARRDPRAALVGFLTNLLLDALQASPETYASSRVH